MSMGPVEQASANVRVSEFDSAYERFRMDVMRTVADMQDEGATWDVRRNHEAKIGECWAGVAESPRRIYSNIHFAGDVVDLGEFATVGLARRACVDAAALINENADTVRLFLAGGKSLRQALTQLQLAQVGGLPVAKHEVCPLCTERRELADVGHLTTFSDRGCLECKNELEHGTKEN
jgi:hypothetical protein